MNRSKTALLVFAGATAGVLAVGFANGQLGPLDPPVTDTSPSLSELHGGFASPKNPWQVFTAPLSGELPVQLSALKIEGGRVYIHQITLRQASIALFDGHGQINADSTVSAGNVVARAGATVAEGTDGRAAVTTETVPLGVVVTNGLYAAWQRDSDAGWITVLYRELD